MSSIKEQKKQQVKELSEVIKKSPCVVVLDYRGITVEQDTPMRSAFRKAGVKYMVVKNSIASRAFEQAGLKGFDATFEGPTAIAIAGEEDITASARIAVEYTKKTPIKVKSGAFEGGYCDEAKVKEIASIPGKNELLSMLLGLLTSPMRSLAVAVNEVAKQKSA